MAPSFQKTLTFNHYIINYGRICFLKLDNAISLLPNKAFLKTFLDTKQFLAMKMINHPDKQLKAFRYYMTPSVGVGGIGSVVGSLDRGATNVLLNSVKISDFQIKKEVENI